MKHSPQSEKAMNLLRLAVTKHGYRPSARSLGTNPMVPKRFAEKGSDPPVSEFYRFAALAGYQVKLDPSQPSLPFRPDKKARRHKGVTKNMARVRKLATDAAKTAADQPHLSRKDMLMVAQVIHRRNKPKQVK